MQGPKKVGPKKPSFVVPSTSKLMQMALERINAVGGKGPKKQRYLVQLGNLKNGERPVRFVDVHTKNGQVFCTLQVFREMHSSSGDIHYEEFVHIHGSNDTKPIEEKDLPFPVFYLVDAILTWILYPAQAKQMHESVPRK